MSPALPLIREHELRKSEFFAEVNRSENNKYCHHIFINVFYVFYRHYRGKS